MTQKEIQEGLSKEQSDYYDRLERIAAEHGLDHSYWSMDDDPSAPHPFGDATTMQYDNYFVWDVEEKRLQIKVPVLTTPIIGPSYLDLWRAADKLITASGDGHHVYIEHFELEGDVLRLVCGS